MRRGVVDVGSGSVLLLVAEGGEAVYETSTITSLGEGVKETGRLKPERMEATLEAIRRAFADARSHGAESIHAAGTMALRLAQNRDEFLRRAEAQGTPVRVLSAGDEAELGFRAVAEDPAFARHDRLTIVDIGGQSTELTVARREGAAWDRTFQHSFPLGTLGLRGTWLPSETPDPGEILSATERLDEAIGVQIAPADAGAVVATGAPGTDLVMVREGWTDWVPARVHGQYLDYEEVGKAVGWLMRMTDVQRDTTPGVERGRGRTVHAGTLILERFLNALAAPGVWVSVRGWRYAWRPA